MTKPVAVPSDPPSLRRLLHEKIEQMDGKTLSLAHRVLLQIELDELSHQLDEAFDAEIRAGRITPESIQKTIEQFRAEHPYGR